MARRELATGTARAGRITHWRQILIILCLAFAGSGLAGQYAHVPAARAGGNEDAAHACQNGGYLNLAGVGSNGQIITFQNVGQCVSYVAHGGVFTTPLPACTIDSSHGCLTFNGDTFPSTAGTGYSITLTGATSFDDSCLGGCTQNVFPNALATGGGDYTLNDSSGAVLSKGTYRIADTAGSSEGLYYTIFADDFGNATTCSAASGRGAFVVATLIDGSTGATQVVYIGADTSASESLGGVFVLGDAFEGPVPSTAIAC